MAPSELHPAPQIGGRFIDSDGTQLRLHYVRDARAETFVGVTKSACMVPDSSGSREGTPLDLSKTPIGTEMTVYYVRQKAGKRSENVILAIRFDRVPNPKSMLPVGVYIPCVKTTEGLSPKS